MIGRAAGVVEIGQGRDVGGQLISAQLGDGSPTDPGAHQAVVIEDGDAVTGQPHVALEAGGTETQGQPEGVQGVLRGVRPGPTVSEADWRS